MSAHHSIAIRENICRGCTHCMKKCPTTSIRIHKGHARIDPARCVDCGQCMQVCPHHAIGVEQSPFEMLFAFQKRVAVLPALFFAQFEDGVPVRRIALALRDIGFTHLYLAELGVDIVRLLNLKEKPEVRRPVVSSFCPAVARLVRTRYPGLAGHISRLRPPGQIAAIFARAEVDAESGDPSQTGVFHVSPCPAQIADFKTGEGEEPLRIFDGVLNLDTVYNKVRNSLSRNKRRFATETASASWLPKTTATACTWSLINGEVKDPPKGKRFLGIDEIHQVIEFLEEMEEEEGLNIDFLELKACSEGCVGGILCARNKFLAKERLQHIASGLPRKLSPETARRILRFSDLLTRNAYIETPEEDCAVRLDTDIGKAIHKMERMKQITAVLPGIDCGLCGAPTCALLAHDIAQGQASIRQCAVLRLKDPKELNSLAKIWGEKRANGKDALI